MRSFIRRTITEGAKPRAGYPYANAFPIAAQLREHLEDGLESVAKTKEIAGEKKAALAEYVSAAKKIIPLLGDLQDALSDLED